MPKRILLADDSITIQKVVELTFSDGDYEVTARFFRRESRGWRVVLTLDYGGPKMMVSA